jgi:hypothetical protein
MLMNRPRYFLILAVVAVCQPSSAAAAPSSFVDQMHVVTADAAPTNYYLDYPGDHMEQTFTVRHSGRLAGVGVQVSLLPDFRGGVQPPIDDLHLKVTRVGSNGFALVDQVVAEATIRPESLPITRSLEIGPLTDVDLTSWDVPVTSGDRLAIVLSSNQTDHSGPERGTNYLWFMSHFNPHPGGECSIYSPRLYGPLPLRDRWLGEGEPTVDAGFRVFLTPVPEPTTRASLLVLLASLQIAHARARRGPGHAPIPQSSRAGRLDRDRRARFRRPCVWCPA